MVHKIENNYNQIWYGIKANKKQICKLQLSNLCDISRTYAYALK